MYINNTMVSTPKIIALSGKIGSGKNYIGETLIFNYLRRLNKNVVLLAFADYLKITCNLKDRILYDRLFRDKDIESRRMLQNRGTVEKQDNENIFIEAMDCMIHMFLDRKVEVIIITDLRFKNEFEYLKNNWNALCIRVNSPQRTYDKMLKECEGSISKLNIISNHVSETELDDCKSFEHTICNDYQNQSNIEYEIKQLLDTYYL